MTKKGGGNKRKPLLHFTEYYELINVEGVINWKSPSSNPQGNN